MRVVEKHYYDFFEYVLFIVHPIYNGLHEEQRAFFLVHHPLLLLPTSQWSALQLQVVQNVKSDDVSFQACLEAAAELSEGNVTGLHNPLMMMMMTLFGNTGLEDVQQTQGSQPKTTQSQVRKTMPAQKHPQKSEEVICTSC